MIDEGFTRIPAYAPRTSLKPTTYTDETTTFYWAILPATAANGSDGASARPAELRPRARSRSSRHRRPCSRPAPVQAFLDQPTFRWSPTLGARRYRLAGRGRPDLRLSARRRRHRRDLLLERHDLPGRHRPLLARPADDENLTGLTWSATGTFQKKLGRAGPERGQRCAGRRAAGVGVSSVQGASSYDLAIDQPDGTHRDYTDIRTPAASFIKMTGTGVWHWRVRAEFPKDLSGTVPGPYSPSQSFTRTIGEPANAKTDSAQDHVLLTWDPRLGVKEYKVQIASTPDFSRTVETTTTDNPNYAPTMTSFSYQTVNVLYWRVAGVDEDRNQGDWTQAQQIKMLPRLKVSMSGLARHKRMSSVRVTVMSVDGKRLKGARSDSSASASGPSPGRPTRTEASPSR